MATVLDPKPTNQLISDPKPTNQLIVDNNFIYLETKTINQGQPVPFGLNWLMTYPTTLTFQGQRL